MKSHKQIATMLILLLMSLVFVGCGAGPAPSQPSTSEVIIDEANYEPPNQVIELASPESGKSHVIGRVVSEVSGNGIGSVPVMLADVVRDENGENGVFALDTAHSPFTEADEHGYFSFENVDPAEYVIVFGVVEQNRYSLLTLDNGDADVRPAAMDEVLDLETIEVADIFGYGDLMPDEPIIDGYPAPSSDDPEGYPYP